MNPLMNRDHLQLDVLYIATAIRLLLRAELSISVVTVQAYVAQITNSYHVSMKAWLAKQRALSVLFGDW